MAKKAIQIANCDDKILSGEMFVALMKAISNNPGQEALVSGLAARLGPITGSEAEAILKATCNNGNRCVFIKAIGPKVQGSFAEKEKVSNVFGNRGDREKAMAAMGVN